MKKWLAFKIVSIFFAVVFLGAGIVTSVAVNMPMIKYAMETFVIGYHSTTSEAERQTVNASGDALAELIEAEGIVMVENRENALPLSKEDEQKLSVFGWSSTVWVPGGGGSGRVESKTVSHAAGLYAETGLLKAITAYGNETVKDEEGNEVTDGDGDPVLKNPGIDYFKDLETFYRDFNNRLNSKGLGLNIPAGTRPNFGASDHPPLPKGTLYTYDFQYSTLIEPTMKDYDDYDNTLLSDAIAFSDDVALVVISRVSGESNDSPKVQYKGSLGETATSPNTSNPKLYDPDRHYLEISTEEEDLLTYVGENYGKVVVIINSTNTMELGFMNEIPGLDACLVVGGTGMNAATAIPKVLYGDVNPSGRLADTYAYDLRSNPSFYNIGHMGEGEQAYYIPTGKGSLYPIGDQNGNFHNKPTYNDLAYIDYQETIYVGYKWYETAYAEGFVWETPEGYLVNFGNDEVYDTQVVQYPFGSGQSYTTFEWNIERLTHNNNGNLLKDDTVEIDIRVTNTGDVAGKDVVQLYYTPQFNDKENPLEKAAVNLLDFKKTPIIEPSGNSIVTLTFKVSDMASYDAYGRSEQGYEGYVLESGDYSLSIRDNSHDFNTAKFEVAGGGVVTYNVPSNYQYDTDSKTGNEIENRLTGDDAIDGVPMDGSQEEEPVKYLSRHDFEGTFPEAPEGKTPRGITDDVKKLNQYTEEMADDWATKNEPDPSDIPVFGQSGDLGLFTETDTDFFEPTELGLELGANYDDERWDDLLEQMPASEIIELLEKTGNRARPAPSVGKDFAQFDVDGPGMYGSFVDAVDMSIRGTGFPNATVIAQTFNEVLAYNMGLTVGNDAIAAGNRNAGWYGPGINIHRSPFGSRNYEYYSEDPVLTGRMALKAIRGAKNKGVYSYLKHIALYDQDNNRDGLYVWCTEQALREIYLKPFEIAIKSGDAIGLMSAYNRIGAVWAGGSEGLITGIVRNEWGFNGAIITDYVDRPGFMMLSHALRGGADIAINGGGTLSLDKHEFAFFVWDSDARNVESNAMKVAIKRAAKNVLYTTMNAKAAAAAYIPEDDPDNQVPTIVGGARVLNFNWITNIIIPLIFILSVLCMVWAALSFVFSAKKKKQLKLAAMGADGGTASDTDVDKTELPADGIDAQVSTQPPELEPEPEPVETKEPESAKPEPTEATPETEQAAEIKEEPEKPAPAKKTSTAAKKTSTAAKKTSTAAKKTSTAAKKPPSKK